MEKILARYIRPSHPLTANYMSGVKGGRDMVVEITPVHFTVWDVSKVGPELLKMARDAAVS